MPSGQVHSAVNVGLLVVIGLVAVNRFWWQNAAVWVFVATYLISTFLLSPDLDLTRSESRRRWGALGLLWAPYARGFKHRGLSHHWLLGPLSRVLYLVVLVAIPVLLVRPEWGPPAVEWTRAHGLPLALGVYLPHWLHVFVDVAFDRKRGLRL